MNKKLLNLIASNKLFNGLETSLLDTENIKGELLTFREGSLIYSEGDPAENLYLVMEGKVNIVKTASLGNPESEYFTKDDFFGLEEIIENIPRISTAVAVTDLYLIGFGLAEVRLLIRQSDVIKKNILEYSNIKKLEQIDEFLARQEIAEELSREEHKPGETTEIKEEDDGKQLKEPEPAAEEPAEDVTEEKFETIEKVKSVDESEPSVEIVPGEEDENVDSNTVRDSNITIAEEESETENEINDTREIVDLINLDSSDFEAELWKDDEKPSAELPDDAFGVAPFDEDNLPVEPDYDTENIETEPDIIEETPADEAKQLEIKDETNGSGKEPENISAAESETVAQKEKIAMLDDNFFRNMTQIYSAENFYELQEIFVSVVASLLETEYTFFFEFNEFGRLAARIKINNSEKVISEEPDGLIAEALNNQKLLKLTGASAIDFIEKSCLNKAELKAEFLIVLPLREDKIKYGLLIAGKSFREEPDDNLYALLELYKNAFLNHARNIRFLNGKALEAKQKLTENLNAFLQNNIKNKISVIRNYAKTIREKEEPAEKNKLADYITEETIKITQSLKDIELLAIEGKSLKKIQIKLSGFLNEFLQSRSDYFKEKYCNIFPEFNFEGFVSIDPFLFEKALDKIVKNACEAMPFGGNLEIKLTLENGYVSISFIDNGSGIKPEDLPFVFEPFTGFNKAGSAGLGLTVARKIIELHRGVIELKPRKEQGATVTIMLPVSEL